MCVLAGGDSKHVALYDSHEGALICRVIVVLGHSDAPSSKLTGKVFHMEGLYGGENYAAQARSSKLCDLCVPFRFFKFMPVLTCALSDMGIGPTSSLFSSSP